MAECDWNYRGDVNLRHGGIFWRETVSEDTVEYVRVDRMADVGGPDNLFRVCSGTLHVADGPDIRTWALSIAGADEDTATREDLLLALDAYGGSLRDDEEVMTVRVGPPDATWSGRGEYADPDCVLRSNQSLRKWVEREYLCGPELVAGPRP